MSELLHCPAVLALELAPGSVTSRRVLERDEAAHIAGLLAEDLRRLLPGAEHLHLACAGALYDAAQLLRPGFPAFAALGELAERASLSAGTPQVIAFGASDGAMPLPALQPLDEPGVGAMLFLPWSLYGAPEPAEALGARMEHEFLARGEAGAELADLLMRLLDVRLEHARFLTRHDLCALTCVQLEHAGFSSAWEMLETALLAPQSTHRAMSPRGRTWQWRDGAAHTASPGFAAWRAEQGAHVGPAQRAHEWAGALFELRQVLALFSAHALPVVFDDIEQVEGGVIETLAPADAQLPAPRIFAHEAPGLGVVALSVAQTDRQTTRVLAHAYPLAPRAHESLCAVLAQRYDCDVPPQRAGRVMLDAAADVLAIPPLANTR